MSNQVIKFFEQLIQERRRKFHVKPIYPITLQCQRASGTFQVTFVCLWHNPAGAQALRFLFPAGGVSPAIMPVQGKEEKKMKSQYVEGYFEKIEDRIVKKQSIKTNVKYLRKPSLSDQTFITTQDDSRSSFNFTYKASRHEQGWLLDSLGHFYEHQWISDVTRMAKGGKEASVYLCQSGKSAGTTRLLAAKVYRPRMFRNLKNDRIYRTGRPALDEDGNIIRDLGMLKAEKKRSVYGELIRHQSWMAYEFDALQKLSAAGADVPRPYEKSDNAILMDFIGDELESAPTLNTVS